VPKTPGSVPLPNSAPDSLTPANQKLDRFLLALTLLSLGAGSAFGAGEARIVEMLAKPRKSEGKCILRRCVLVEMEEVMGVEGITGVGIDGRKYIQNRYLGNVNTSATFHHNIWDGHEGRNCPSGLGMRASTSRVSNKI